MNHIGPADILGFIGAIIGLVSAGIGIFTYNGNKDKKGIFLFWGGLVLAIIGSLVIFFDFFPLRFPRFPRLIPDISSTAESDPVPSYSESEPDPDSEPEPESHVLPYEVTSDPSNYFSIRTEYFSRAKALSYISKRGTGGSVSYAMDGDVNTSWQCGENYYGIGEWLIAYNPDCYAENISSVTVYNGFQNTRHNDSNKDYYFLNTRVKGFTLEFDDGTYESFTLKDRKGSQTFTFNTRNTCYVKFIINSVYYGDKYTDTCVAEIIYK